jgi:hypothetical protein
VRARSGLILRFAAVLYVVAEWAVVCIQLAASSETDWCLSVGITALDHTGSFYTTGFNVPKFYVLPTQCIYVFCVDLRTNSDYFHIQH